MTLTEDGWSPFERSNAIGDAGRQPEILSVSSDLNVGVADTALDFLTIGPLEIRACSSRGWSHRHKGTPRQDAYSLLVGEDIVVIAVADGVSEGEHSQVAADTAARATVKLAADQIAKKGSVDWLQLSRRVALRIVEEAEYRQIVPTPEPDADINDRVKACRAKMSTTLIAAVIQQTPDSDGFAVEVGVVAGDSAAYQRSVGGETLDPVGGGKADGTISSTTVKPLPGPANPESIQLHLKPGELLLLGTDGIGDPVGDGTNEVGRELAHRWAEPPTIDKFLLDVNVYRRTFDDDRTAVGLWVRPDVELPAPADPTEEASSAGAESTDVFDFDLEADEKETGEESAKPEADTEVEP